MLCWPYAIALWLREAVHVLHVFRSGTTAPTRRRVLAAATPAATRDLRAAIAGIAAGNGNDAGPAAGIRLNLPRLSLRPALRATLMPAGRLDPDGFGGAAGSVAILVSEPDAPPPIDREALADTFGLTGREAEIAVLLAGGIDLAAIAATLDLGLGTVRNHLKRLFQKTGVNSQAALVALARGFTRLDLS
jgi:DNA-binding CsgD family transcriptional regulator